MADFFLKNDYFFVILGQLNLQIPWKNLYTQPVEAVLDEVYLLIVPTASKLIKKWN